MRASDRRLRQRVIDSEQRRCCFVQVPFLMLNDVVVGRLQPTAVILWLYYKRRAWEEHSAGPPTESLRQIEERSGLSRGTILAARKSLADTGWIELQVEGSHRDQVVTVVLLDRWQENTDEICSRHGPTAATVQNLDNPSGFGRNPDMHVQKPAMHVQNLDKAELDSGLKTPEEIKDPSGGIGVSDLAHQGILPLLVKLDRPLQQGDDLVEDLLIALCGVLRLELAQLPADKRRQEEEGARKALTLGATPSDVEEWAHAALADPHRPVGNPVSLHAFVREWPTWRARRRDRPTATRLRIANGRIPE